MRIFMTGATGYIGEKLALALAARGHEVFALVRSVHKAAALEAAGIRLVKGDLADTAALTGGMQDCEAVYHLAAYARVWPEDAAVFNKVNVAGTRQVLEACLQSRVKRVIITSTAGVYGPSPRPGIPVDENTIRQVPYFTAYEASKAAAEALAKEYARTSGVSVILLNPARVYGPGKQSESNPIGHLVRLYLAGKWHFLPGDGEGTGSYCYIDDVVQAHLNALTCGRSGESYLLGGENVSYLQFFSALQKVSGKKVTLFRLPLSLLLLVSKLQVLAARLLPVRPLITPSWTRRYLYSWEVSSQKALRDLRYRITPLEEGLKLTINQIHHDSLK